MNFLFEPFQGLADAFSNLRQLPRTKNDEYDDQNDDQFRNAHRPEHDLIPL
jgi:hypothetical protein